MSELRCGRCGRGFDQYRERKLHSESGVFEVEELRCEKGHVGKFIYGPSGHVEQRMNIKRS